MSDTASSKTSISAGDEDPSFPSAPEVVIVDGTAKFRDGKKWKPRYCVLTKLSPAADCLQLQIYRDEKERVRNGHTKASLSLQDFLAMESGFTLDKESHTLAIICLDLSVVLAFDNRERLIQWSVRISNNLGEGQNFLLQLASAPSKSKLTPGPARLHITDKKFCLTGGIPPRLLGFWEVGHLRRYGVVEGRIVFEGGSRSGKGEGVHVLVAEPSQTQIIIDAFDLASKGQLSRVSGGGGGNSTTGSSKRFGSGVTDSPRKSLMSLGGGSSRLSEIRGSHSHTLSSSIPQDSSMMNMSSMNSMMIMNANSSCSSVSSGGSGSSHNNHHNPPPHPPRESWSAEGLSLGCSGCGEHGGGGGVDNCDSLSIVCGGPGGSPARVIPAQQPLQILPAKPLPSAMERCMSCMSKLGQQGGGGGDNILSPSWTMDLPSTINNPVVVPQGSGGGASNNNSDRLSISSHGSGSAGGCQDHHHPIIPSNNCYTNYDTPRSLMNRGGVPGPGGIFCNGNGSASPSCRPRGGVGGPTGPTGPCSCSQCHSHCSNPNKSLQTTSTSKSHQTHINLHIPGGPYENYDFPRSMGVGGVPIPASSASSSGGGSTCHHQYEQGGGGIDWNKKMPMDRSSIATNASTSLSMLDSSHSHQEYYDTPKNLQGCPCCPPVQNSNSNNNCPCCVGRPLENSYDVPPPSSIISINGEGKMPLVTTTSGGTSKGPNPNAIYAQVDKTKKTSRGQGGCDNHHLHHHLHHNHHNNLPIYENRGALDCQQVPMYANVAEDKNPNSKPLPPDPTPPPSQGQGPPGPTDQCSNYVNMQFCESLQIYENAKEVNVNKDTLVVLVHPEPKTIKENFYENAKEPEVEIKDPPSPPNNDSGLPSSTEESRRGSQDDPEVPGPPEPSTSSSSALVPLRRSSSVPCKGAGHVNRGSASSSDSGVSGDGCLFLDDHSPTNNDNIGSLCLHESLPRSKNNHSHPSKGSPTTCSSKPNNNDQDKPPEDSGTSEEPPQLPVSPTLKDPSLANRHYETIEEANKDNNTKPVPVPVVVTSSSNNNNKSSSLIVNPSVAAVKGINQTGSGSGTSGTSSSGNSSSDSIMSDYIETLSISSSTPNPALTNLNMNLSISESPKKSTSLKPRSGKEYLKIDRSVFKE